jgi:hypothetical protein
VISWLERFGKSKEGWVFLGLLLYPAGYLASSYYHWRSGLGAVPLLDKQYFIAGAAPVATLLLAWFIATIANELSKRMHLSYLGEGEAALSSTILWLVIGAIWILPGGSLPDFNESLHFQFPSNDWSVQLFFVWILVGLISLSASLYSTIGQSIRTGFGLVFVLATPFFCVVIPLSLLLQFMNNVYPGLPAELGGERPECAYLDIARDSLSAEVLSALVASSPTTTAADTKVRRSVLVNVLSSSQEATIVRRPEEPGLPYELRGTSIRSITWPDDRVGPPIRYA